jgi:chromosome partitioning protein
MARRYACFNQKGGVGKSTVAIDFTAALAEDDPEGSYLLIDWDAQGHATEGIGKKEAWSNGEGVNLYHAVMQPNQVSIADLIQEVPGERFFVIPSNFHMMIAEQELANARNREDRLADLLDELDDAFTAIVVDSPSYFGNFTDNVLRAIGVPYFLKSKSDPSSKVLQPRRPEHRYNGLVVPVQAEQTSVRALELLINQVQVVSQDLKVEVDIWAIVPNMVQESRLARNILNDFRSTLANKMTSFDIPKRVCIQEAYAEGKSIFTYEPKDRNGKVDRAKMKDVIELRNLYGQLAALILERSGLRDAARIN